MSWWSSEPWVPLCGRWQCRGGAASLGFHGVSAGNVVVEQEALGSTVGAALAPLLEDLGQAVVDTPTGVDCLLVLEDLGQAVVDTPTGVDCLLVLEDLGQAVVAIPTGVDRLHVLERLHGQI